MKLDCALAMDALTEIPAVARAAEGAGFAGIWANDTKHNPFVTLTSAALHTSRLELGTGIAVAFSRSPMVTAQTAWDLARLSGGRFLLGLGTQVRAHIERRFGMPWDPPAPKLREYVQAVRAIWRTWQEGAPLRVRGRYYNLNLMGPFFSPGPNAQPTVPILIAGVNEVLCRLAGELADGFIAHPIHSVTYLRGFVRPHLAEGLAKAGRRRTDLQLYAPVIIAPGETPDEQAAALARARARIAFYGSTPTYRVLLQIVGYADVADRLRQMVSQGRMSEIAGQVPDGLLDAIVIQGTYDEIGHQLRERYAGLADRVASYWPFTLDEQAGWIRMVRAFYER
ncbi:MAG TPA: TIGR03617 family F420-dependent LLM class oxidoreductase [bacterium]|nr:TIGR03617 family F420-dependent LLM class oxidoreductase [bacterium]